MQKLQKISNDELVNRTVRLATAERSGQVELLRYLGEIDERKLFLELGYSSLWDFCRRALKFSEGISQQRIMVARAARKHPEILSKLGDGSLTLCAAADLVPGLNETSAAGLFEAASGKSRREVQKLVAVDGKNAPQRDLIRKVAGPTVVTPDLDLENLGSAKESKHRVAFTASGDVVAKLEKLQALMEDATLEEIFDKAADLLLAKIDPAQRQARREARAQANQKAAGPKKPVTMPRRPPAELRDRVLVEAGRRCEFVSASGTRCAETKHLSIDHIRPYALGGTSTDHSNLRCLCMAHNRHLGRKTFGTIRSGPTS